MSFFFHCYCKKHFNMACTHIDHRTDIKMFKTLKWKHSPAARGSTWVLNIFMWFLWSIRVQIMENCCRIVNPRTYTHISYPHHSGTEGGGGGGRWWNSSPEFLMCCSISKRFCLRWKASDLLNKIRYILWVVALLEAFNVANNGRHLGFYQELEIRLQSR